MKICDLCQQVTNHLHSGPKGAEKLEICDLCRTDVMERITKLQRDEARMREVRWAAMIQDWKSERSVPDDMTSPSADHSVLKP